MEVDGMQEGLNGGLGNRGSQHVMQDRDEIDRRNNNVSRVNHQLDNIPERLEQGEEVIAVEHRNLICFYKSNQS